MAWGASVVFWTVVMTVSVPSRTDVRMMVSCR